MPHACLVPEKVRRRCQRVLRPKAATLVLDATPGGQVWRMQNGTTLALGSAESSLWNMSLRHLQHVASYMTSPNSEVNLLGDRTEDVTVLLLDVLCKNSR